MAAGFAGLFLPEIVCAACATDERIFVFDDLEARMTKKFGAVFYDIRPRGGGRGKRAKREGSIGMPHRKITREAHGKAAFNVATLIGGDFCHEGIRCHLIISMSTR